MTDEPNRRERSREEKRIDSVGRLEKGKFVFEAPPEAPVFEPSAEEFQNPLKYIAKIRKVAERHGICKIIPPPDWCSPFCVDVDRFKFTPSVQKLNELDGGTRVRMNFLEKIGNYWHLRGVRFEIPVLERRVVDLYSLYKFVELKGGFARVCSAKKWSRVARRMGYKHKQSSGIALKYLHEKWLDPIAVSYRGKGIRLSADQVLDDSVPNYCQKCGKSDDAATEEAVAIADDCDGCDLSFRGKCLIIPLTEAVPEGQWKCHKCVVAEEIVPSDAFGFEQARREYTLEKFGEMADAFKEKYFDTLDVPPDRVEREYWKILGSVDSRVTAEYGADLNTSDHGSGFATALAMAGNEQNAFYRSRVQDPWNLNNVPVSRDSVLAHVDAAIPGMTVPWTYVGMCFSTFCWRNEDHWSYSISFLHWGQPKTWYGVPASGAEAFERVLRDAAPELFHRQPDLLDQLTTVLDPGRLMRAHVPIYRTDQRGGEFVVTFPRSYHSGFDQGFNFSESANFAPADWLPLGRQCVEHYSGAHRKCVFSHDELVMNMARCCDDLTPRTAKFVFRDLREAANFEIDKRQAVVTWGVTNAEFVEFERLEDDLRQCAVCNTTLYLSAVTCSCDPQRMACLRHFKLLCRCAAQYHTFQYRYTLDELSPLLRRVRARSQSSYDA